MASSIRLKLSSVQLELKVPKSQKNTFGNYNYRNCEDILEALKPKLSEAGLVLILTDDLVNIGDRYYVKATALLYDTDTEEVIEVSALAREEESKKGMDGSQITGAASSYARKYALNGMFAIDDTKDADSLDNTKAAAVKASPGVTKPMAGEATVKQKQLIADKLKGIGITEKLDIKKYIETEWDIKDASKLTKDEASQVIEDLIANEEQENFDIDYMGVDMWGN